MESDVPEIAAFIAERLGSGPAYLGTTDERGAPRVHPVTPVIGGDRLFVFMEPTSPKGRDLRERGWYALHNGVPDNEGTGGECALRGRAVPIDDAAVRELAASSASYEPADRYILFELLIDDVAITQYGAGDGGVRRARWTP